MSTMSATALSRISESSWMRTVLDGFRVFGWHAYHTHDSRHSAAGFPDVVAVHPGQRRAIYVELKSETGKLTADQYDWRDALVEAGQEWYLWRPSGWPTAERVMRGERLAMTRPGGEA